MTFYPRTESDKSPYRQGALPWVGFIAQAQIHKRPPQPIKPKTERPHHNKQAQRQRKVHEENLIKVLACIKLNMNTISLLCHTLHVSRTEIQTCCAELTDAHKVQYELGTKGVRYYSARRRK